MSENPNDQPERSDATSDAEPVARQPESQKERWLKYGANVVLSTIVVIALAIVVTYAAERKPKRVDTTLGGLYSLKPQTLNVIGDLKSPVKIVSLYTRSKSPDEQNEPEDPDRPKIAPDEAAQTVSDLLQEYQTKGKNITVEEIDPVTSPTKADDLIATVTAKYGGEVDKYKKFIDDTFTKGLAKINDLAKVQVPKAEAMTKQMGSSASGLVSIAQSVQELPQKLQDLQDQIKKPLKQKPPDYKAVTDAIQGNMQLFSTLMDGLIGALDEAQKDPKVPQEIRDYIKTNLPDYQQIKSIADDILKQSKSLGELKLDTLRSALRQKDSILVMGEKEWRVIPFEQVWKTEATSARGATDATLKPQFSGEQRVTAAILAVSQAKKQKVVFCVPPDAMGITDPGAPPFQPAGELSDVADRLRSYDFEVMEKDLTGQAAMRAQMQGQPPPQEPSDEEIKDAVWVVLNVGSQSNPEMGPPPSIGPKVAEHLKNGGSAVIVSAPRAEDLSPVLKDWGIEMKPDIVCVHEPVKQAGGASGDIVQEALRRPPIFNIHQYGDAPPCKPLRSLSGLFPGISPVMSHEGKGYKVWPMLPVPDAPAAPKSWGESDLEQISNPTFDASKGDLPGPLFGGAASEKDAGNRLVLISVPQFMSNFFLEYPDPNLEARHIRAAWFPGNGELFMDSVFWAAHMDPLIAISPTAMDVSRIRDMSPGTLRAWRVGLLLVGLPGAVLLCGLGVFFARRD